MIVAFFGHRDTPSEIQPQLERTLVDLIVQHNATHFYVGHNGNFDNLVHQTLQKLSAYYPHISAFVILSHFPINHASSFSHDTLPTIYPEGLELIHPRYAIIRRNRWMVEHCDCVVAYVTHNFGGAAEFLRLAERRKKLIYNLACYSL